MSDQDETMRLAAEIVNKWSGPLTDMRRDLRKLADDVKGTHAAGAAHAKKHGDAISGLRKEFQRLDEHVKSTGMQTMAAFGLSALSVAGAVAAIKDAVFGFGDSTRQLTFLRRETGLAIDQLRQYEALARRVGAAPGAMSKGIQDFAQHMQNLRRLAPEELNAWATGFDRNANQFARSLARMSNPDALSGAIGFLDRIPSPQDKRKWLRMLGLPEDLANVPVAELRKQMAEIQKSIGSLGPDAEKSAERFNSAIDRMNDSIDRLKLTIGSGLANAFADGIGQLRAFIDQNRNELIGDLKAISSGIHTTLQDARELMQVYNEFRSGGLTGPIGPAEKKFLGEPDVDALAGVLRLRKHPLGEAGKLWNHLQQTPSNIPPGADFMPMAYHPGGGLRSGGGFTMLGAGASSGSPEEVIAKGTHIGVLQALREFRNEVEGSSTGAGGGGMMAANYSPGGGMGGAGGGISGSLRRSLGGAYAPAGAGTGAGGPLRSEIGSGEAAITPAAGGPGLAADRARFANELARKPWLKDRIMQISLGENTDSRANLAVMETIFNRASARGISLEEATKGVAQGGYYPGSTFSGGARNMQLAKYMAMARAHWDQVMGGSNISNYATDNSSQGLAMRERATGRFTFQSQFGGAGGTGSPGMETFFSPGGAGGSGRASRSAYLAWLRGVAAGAGVAPSAGGVWAAPGYSAEMYSPFGRHGSALRDHFGYRGHGGDLLRHGKQSGMYPGGGQLKGSAHLAIDFRGMPKGTRTKLAHSGFSEVRLNHGRTMVPASQDS
jgi:hypothetical protein